MQITWDKENGKLIAAITGKVDSITAPELESTLRANLDGVTEVVLDLKDMTHISSAGLRAVLKVKKALRRKGKITVRNVNDEVQDIFQMTGFTKVVTVE